MYNEHIKTMHDGIKIDLGCGRVIEDGFVGIDITQIKDGHGFDIVHIVRDIQKNGLPFCDDSVDEAKATDFLEHIDDLRFSLNEIWRVLKPGAILWGNVPVCGSAPFYKDPTHKRCFVKDTFSYFTGLSEVVPKRPGHPRYADYGFLPWKQLELRQEESGIIFFKLTPNKSFEK